MSVIPLTIFFSLLLAGLFIGLFAFEQRRRRFASAESDSLLPLADELPRLAVAPGPAAAEPGHPHRDPDHGDACGCRDGSRPPCAGCKSKSAQPAPPAP